MQVIAAISWGPRASATCVGDLFLDWKVFLLLQGVEGRVSCEREGSLPWS